MPLITYGIPVASVSGTGFNQATGFGTPVVSLAVKSDGFSEQVEFGTPVISLAVLASGYAQQSSYGTTGLICPNGLASGTAEGLPLAVIAADEIFTYSSGIECVWSYGASPPIVALSGYQGQLSFGSEVTVVRTGLVPFTFVFGGSLPIASQFGFSAAISFGTPQVVLTIPVAGLACQQAYGDTTICAPYGISELAGFGAPDVVLNVTIISIDAIGYEEVVTFGTPEVLLTDITIYVYPGGVNVAVDAGSVPIIASNGYEQSIDYGGDVHVNPNVQGFTFVFGKVPLVSFPGFAQSQTFGSALTVVPFGYDNAAVLGVSPPICVSFGHNQTVVFGTPTVSIQTAAIDVATSGYAEVCEYGFTSVVIPVGHEVSATFGTPTVTITVAVPIDINVTGFAAQSFYGKTPHSVPHGQEILILFGPIVVSITPKEEFGGAYAGLGLRFREDTEEFLRRCKEAQRRWEREQKKYRRLLERRKRQEEKYDESRDDADFSSARESRNELRRLDEMMAKSSAVLAELYRIHFTNLRIAADKADELLREKTAVKAGIQKLKSDVSDISAENAMYLDRLKDEYDERIREDDEEAVAVLM